MGRAGSRGPRSGRAGPVAETSPRARPPPAVSITLLSRSCICSGGKHPAQCAPKTPTHQSLRGCWAQRWVGASQPSPAGAGPRGRGADGCSGHLGCRLPAQWRGFSPKCFPPNLLFGLGFYFLFFISCPAREQKPVRHRADASASDSKGSGRPQPASGAVRL